MKKSLIYSIAIFWLLLTNNGWAISLQQLQQRFSQHSVTRANFSQDRYIQGINKPLHSTGQMIISKELGLWWQQQTPFIMTLKMNEQRMLQSISDQPPQIIKADEQPQLFQFNSLLAAIFNADNIILEKNFQLNLTEHDQQWQLTLIPKQAPLNKIFNNITLIGDQYLLQIEINDKQNDKTLIMFSDHQTLPLSSNEKRLFQ